jgi:hypothetical protein
MMTLSENSRDSEQNANKSIVEFTMDRMGEEKADARTEIREKQMAFVFISTGVILLVFDFSTPSFKSHRGSLN